MGGVSLYMDTAQILADLRAQRGRIDNAITALEALDGREPRDKAATDDIVKKAGQKVRRTLSAAARKKIAAAQKARWAAKKATKPELAALADSTIDCLREFHSMSRLKPLGRENLLQTASARFCL